MSVQMERRLAGYALGGFMIPTPFTADLFLKSFSEVSVHQGIYNEVNTRVENS